MEILPLTRFTSRQLAVVQGAEARRYRQLLDWDFSAATQIIAGAIDQGLLRGHVLVLGHEPVGYCFLVYDNDRAVLGSFFLLEEVPRGSGEALLRAVLSEALADGGARRVEVQLPAADTLLLEGVLAGFGFRSWYRVYMKYDLPFSDAVQLPADQAFLSWTVDEVSESAELLEAAYLGQIDSHLHHHYASLEGCALFLQDLVRQPGCGVFDARISVACIQMPARRMSGFLVGTRIADGIAHLPQVAVRPESAGRGIGRALMLEYLRRATVSGYTAATLNVTEANTRALELYRHLGFLQVHRFPVFLLERG